MFSLKNSNEPVLIVHAVVALLGWVGTFFVAHGVLTAKQADTLTQTIAPSAVALAVVLVGLVVRKFVSPAWRAAGGNQSEVDALLTQLGLDGVVATTPDGPIAQQPPTADLQPAAPPAPTPSAPAPAAPAPTPGV